MVTCETCGSDYDKSFGIIMADDRHTFDSFEWCDSHLGPDLSPLRLSSHRPRPRSGRADVLLLTAPNNPSQVRLSLTEPDV